MRRRSIPVDIKGGPPTQKRQRGRSLFVTSNCTVIFDTKTRPRDRVANVVGGRGADKQTRDLALKCDGACTHIHSDFGEFHRRPRMYASGW